MQMKLKVAGAGNIADLMGGKRKWRNEHAAKIT
jgi:hypothetical protein